MLSCDRLTADTTVSICPGNNSQICGDPIQVSVYQNTLYSGFPPGAGPTPVAAGVYQGCGSDGVTGRSLDGVANGFADNLMTNELCRSLCDTAGFWLSGTEYATQWSVYNATKTLSKLR